MKFLNIDEIVHIADHTLTAHDGKDYYDHEGEPYWHGTRQDLYAFALRLISAAKNDRDVLAPYMTIEVSDDLIITINGQRNTPEMSALKYADRTVGAMMDALRGKGERAFTHDEFFSFMRDVRAKVKS